MLEQLKWTPLEDRKKNTRLLMLYKIRNQEVKVAASHKLVPPDRISRNTGANSFQIPHHNKERVILPEDHQGLECLTLLSYICQQP